METVKFPFYARLSLVLFSVVLIFVILKVGAGIFVPLMFASLIAILMLPLNQFLEYKLKAGRFVAAFLSVALAVLVMLSFIYVVALQITVFSSDLPSLKRRFIQIFGEFQGWLTTTLHITSGQQTEYINKSLVGLANTAAQSVGNVVFSISAMLLLLAFVFVFSFFILYYRRLLMRFALNLFSVHNRQKVTGVILATKSMINAYISGLVIELFMLGTVSCIMFLIMDIRYPVLLAMMIALLNVIPYLGIYTGIALCMLVTFANSNFGMAFEAGAGLFILHLLDSNILFPRIIGSRVKMNPFVTILAVIVGEYIWGVAGMFLFIPIVSTIKLVCEQVDALKAWSILIGEDVKS